MIARGLRARSGITLTEILIAILIMGVGLISLATLFPLGLLRLREATRNSRAGLTFETAADDMDIRSLFLKSSFSQTWYWTVINNTRIPRDPFVQDADSNGNVGNGPLNGGIIASGSGLVPLNNVGLNSGLPICYDPLWRSINGVYPNVGLSDPTLVFNANYASPTSPANEARFGAGVFNNATVPYLRADPDGFNGGIPSAYGLQRLTNFIPWAPSTALTASNNPSLNFLYPLTCLNLALAQNNQPPDVSGNVCTSIDDIVFNPIAGSANSPSSVIPDMSAGGPQADYRFTWFFTGRQNDAGGNGTQFIGEIVVCDGRPFGFDALPGTTVLAPAGETVVEAIFGYGSNVVDLNFGTGNPATGTGFATGADRSVLLRWKTTMADPQVKVGGWICDVTYERNVAVFSQRSLNSVTSFARCNWYQIGKRTDPQTDVALGNGYRSMVLTLTSPVRAKTLLSTTATSPTPVHMNVALVMPSVINVFARSFEVH